MPDHFVLRGDICYSADRTCLEAVRDGYLVCEDGLCGGVYHSLPEKFSGLSVRDYSGRLIIPGLVDLHVHAPQYAFVGLGMDLELLDWLNTRTFPEEARYADEAYAEKAYGMFVDDVRKGPNTRACVFATVHLPATRLLMDMLESSGLVTMVGKVNMDRNCPEYLCEAGAAESAGNTLRWLEECAERRYKNTSPILTPRFVPACSDELLRRIGEIQREYGHPVQSHLSENQGEIAWVRELCPESWNYADAYARFGLLGGNARTIMAHCVWSGEEETEMLRERGVFVAHCPQSNVNLASGIAPVRRFVEQGVRVGLGSDVAGGCHTSIFRAMSDAIQVSKLYWRLMDQQCAPLTVAEAFYLGTLGGGAFFGRVGSFEAGYEFDALVIDDTSLASANPLQIEERLARVIYRSDDRNITAKYIRGNEIDLD